MPAYVNGTAEIVTVALADPPGPVTVSRYGTPMTGVIAIEPDVGTAPIPWSMKAELPPVLVHVRIDCWPVTTDDGFAPK